MTDDERSCCRSWQIVLIGKYEAESIIRVFFCVLFDVVQYLGAKLCFNFVFRNL
jgi:hypothetical protein